MSAQRVYRHTPRTPEELAALREKRDRIQRERPTLEDIAAEEGRAGEELTTLGEYFALREATFRLKQHRLAAGLTLDEVAERSGIDRAALSRLETGKNLNPTVGTLAKVAAAVGLALTFSLEAAKV